MFSWPFSSSHWHMSCTALAAPPLFSCRKMISRKVRCASVEFWKASKHLFRAKVLAHSCDSRGNHVCCVGCACKCCRVVRIPLSVARLFHRINGVHVQPRLDCVSSVPLHACTFSCLNLHVAHKCGGIASYLTQRMECTCNYNPRHNSACIHKTGLMVMCVKLFSAVSIYYSTDSFGLSIYDLVPLLTC